MKAKKVETTGQTVSKIIQTTDKNGKDVLGFTVYYGEQDFINVLRCFTAENYDAVYQELAEERRQILANPNPKEKK
jgi:hypothetical protein